MSIIGERRKVAPTIKNVMSKVSKKDQNVVARVGHLIRVAVAGIISGVLAVGVLMCLALWHVGGDKPIDSRSQDIIPTDSTS